MRVEAHIAGIQNSEEVKALQERLQHLDGVEVKHVEKTRIVLQYDDQEVDAGDLQTQIEAAGGEVITMDPVEE